MKTLKELPQRQRDILLYSNDPIAFTRDLINLKCEWFHQQWIETFENNKFTVLLAPRGHGKTSIVGSYILWRIARDRRIRILIVTINQDKANNMMSFIQSNLERNEKLKDTFGDFKGTGRTWSRDQIRVRQASKTDTFEKEPTLKVLGVGSKIISGHYDLVVLDDITDGENSRTEGKRRDLENWYDRDLVGTFQPPSPKIINIGTRWHEDDIHAYLMDKAGYITLKYRALLNQKEVDEDENVEAKVLWPDYIPWTSDNSDRITLKFIRGHQGESAFMMQYQNEIVGSGISKFKPEWVDDAIYKFKKLGGVTPMGLKIYIGVDLGGEEKKSDWGVSGTIGIDERGDIYILDCIRSHSTINRQIDIMKSLDDRWHASKIGMDAAAQQKSITSRAMQENPSMPIIPVKSSKINDKDTRTDRLSVLFETGRVYLNPHLTHLVEELRMYPRGRWDDCIDSVCFALEVSHDVNLIDWSRVADAITARKTYKISKL